MTRDLAGFVLAAVLALLALPVTGWVEVPPLPTEPTAYFGIVLAVWLLFVASVGPAAGGRMRALRPLAITLAALPFFVFVAVERGPWVERHAPALLAAAGVLAAVVAVTCLPRRPRAAAAIVLVTLLGGGTVLSGAGFFVVPRSWNPLLAAAVEPAPTTARADDTDRASLRLSPTATPALGEGPGPWWAPSEPGTGRPWVLLLDGGPRLDPTWVPRGVTFFHGSETPFEHALDLEPFDALVVLSGAWDETDPLARAKARAVSGFVRRGGLLIGPTPSKAWPPHLALRLQGASRGVAVGAEGMLELGLGKVARTQSASDALALLAEGAWVRSVRTRFDRAATPPAAPLALERWEDAPAGRRPAGVLMIVYVLALGAFAWALRAPGGRLLGTLLAAAAVSAGLAWVGADDPGVRAHGVVLDLGGRGGRRIEAVFLSAGPGGYRGAVRWPGGGALRVLGGEVGADRDLRIRPGGTAWVVRETLAGGVAPGDQEDRRSAHLRAFLQGDVDPKRLRYGRIPRLAVRIEGLGPVPAATLTYRSP